MFQVKTEQFSGPLEKLLELIEEKKLEVTSLSLAEVTADFLNYLKTIQEKAEPGILADFIVIAAKLILIKSKALLPSLELTKDEESEIKDMETRLRLYGEFSIKSEITSGEKTASQHIKDLLNKNYRSYSKPLLADLGKQSVFYPPADLKLSDLSAAVARLASVLREIIPDRQKVKSAIITIEQKTQELLQRFQSAVQQSFKEVSQNKSKIEAVIIFLAILHLLKDRIIQVEQSGQFEDIFIKKSENTN